MVLIPERKTYGILLADDMTLVREGLAALPAGASFPGGWPMFRGGLGVEGDRDGPPRSRCPGANLPTRIVVLSTKRDRKTVVEGLRCGVNAFLLKSAPWNELVGAFEQVLNGGIYISPDIELNKILASNSNGGAATCWNV
jgi:hypothetical protein